MGGLARHAREHETPCRSHVGSATQQAHDSHLHALGARLWQVALRLRDYTDVDITDHFTLPKVGKPLIKILEEEDFQRLLAACEAGQHPREYALRDRAMLWLLYDTGIRISELATLTFPQLDMRTGVLIAHGKGDKERRIALGSNALAAIRRYLDHARSSFRGSDTQRLCLPGREGPADATGRRAGDSSPEAALWLHGPARLGAHLPPYLRGALSDAGW